MARYNARLDLAVELGVEILEGLHRVGRELNRPAKLAELVGLLEHCVGHVGVGELQLVRQRQPTHARTGYKHVQRVARLWDVTQHAVRTPSSASPVPSCPAPAPLVRAARMRLVRVARTCSTEGPGAYV